MKKILAVLLVLSMAVAMSVPALAAETKTTDITYSASANGGSDDATWTVTVPSSLVAGQSGEVKAEGIWSPSDILSVTADKKVNMYLDGNAEADYAVVPVTYNAIALSGSYAGTVTMTEAVTVDAENTMSDIKFGAWKGVLTFYISLDDNPDYVHGNISGPSGVTGQEELNAILPNGGDIEIASGKYTSVSALYVDEAVHLTVHGGDFTEQIATPGTNDSNGVFSYFKDDVITIEDGTFNGLFLAFQADGVTINISGGTFNINNWVYADSGAWTITITGGTFNLNPTQYLADGYTATQGADNMWTVSAN